MSWRWSFAVVAVLLAITLCRWEIIDSPPYYDAVVQLWGEAEYLADHGFDYWSLRYVQPHGASVHAGMRTYMTSILSTLLALLLIWSPSPTVTLVTYHLFTFLCASITAVVLFAALRPRLDRVSAALVCAVVLVTPVLSTQIDVLASEMTLIACAAACLLLIRREQFTWAAVMSTGAFLIKPTGTILTIAVLSLCCLMWLVEEGSLRSVNRRAYGRAIVASVCLLMFQILVLKWGGSLEANMRERLPFAMARIWCPDVLLLMLAMGLGLAAEAIWTLPRIDTNGTSTNWFLVPVVAVRRWVANHPTDLFCLLVVMGTVMGTTRVAFVPRYLAITVPFIYWVLARLWFTFLGRVAFRCLIVALICFNLANWNGAFFPDQQATLWRWWQVPAGHFDREGSLLERSHEYLVDHRENIRTMHFVEEWHRRYPADPIVAGFPYSCFLSYPSMGYISQPIPSYVIHGFKLRAPLCKEVPELLADRPLHPLFITTANVCYFDDRAWFKVPRPGQTDEVVFRPATDSPVAVWRKGWTPEPPTPEVVKAWYLRQAWPVLQLADPRVDRVRYLLSNGKSPAALAELTRMLTASPFDPVIQQCKVMLENGYPRDLHETGLGDKK